MTASAVARRPSLARLFVGPRAGTTMIALGLLLAALAAVLVMSLGRRTGARSTPTQEVAVSYVVVATRDIAENARVPADALVVKPFPAAYLPAGTAGALEQVAGKYTATRIARDQVVLLSQLTESARGANIAAAVPPGKLAVWLPLPELTAQTGGLRAGDRVDVLLTLAIPAAGQAGSAPSGPAAAATPAVPTTQLTLQNVELFFIGSAAAANGAPSGSGGLVPGQAAPAAVTAAARVAVVLLEPQDALTAKFIKDAGGTIDLALRSRDWPEAVATDPVTLDTLVNRFGFRGRTAGAPAR